EPEGPDDKVRPAPPIRQGPPPAEALQQERRTTATILDIVRGRGVPCRSTGGPACPDLGQGNPPPGPSPERHHPGRHPPRGPTAPSVHLQGRRPGACPMAESTQKKLSRVRAPRVHISY